MINLAEITEKIQMHLQVYSNSLTAYSDEAFIFKADENTWSLGQMYEHLLISTEFFMAQVRGCLKEEKGGWEGEKTPVGEQIFAFGSFPPIEIKVPEKYQTAGEPVAKAKSFYQERFAELIQDLPSLQKEIEANPTNYKRKHAIFGMITASEWFWCIEAHLRHHFRQKEKLEKFASQDV
ncbi:MAG: DinB family protein [Raineya sp.]|nr:DinB family protein [Raineya sp.]MDW8295651.1 DinB family protein [Raineya sp.]